MRDRLAVRHFLRRALGVHMNPLVVGRRFSELIDTMLVDHYPVGQADFFAFQRLRIIYRFYRSHIAVLDTHKHLCPQVSQPAIFC